MNSRLKTFLPCGFVWMTLLCVAGCGGKGVYPTQPAGGVVTFDGAPLEGARVWLLPKSAEFLNAPVLVRPQGLTGADGKFVLTTYYTDDGAPAGEFDIIVLHGEVDPDGDSATPKSKAGKKNRGPVIPHKYKDGKTSGLSATIKSGENNITLDLKSK